MKRPRISYRDVQWAINTATKGTHDHDAYTDLLRCRRALRRIHSIAKLRCSNEGLVYTVNAIREVSAKALGKGDKS